MDKRSRNDLRPIGDEVEDWLDTFGGRERLEAFYRLPQAMQRGAWEGLRRQVEREREGDE
jgi:hypothetical protein